MRIAYRRMSGPIGFTAFETGTRGMWLEKRNALVKELRRRGHEVDFVNRMTKYSQLASAAKFDAGSHDLLMLEFGSSNRNFYGKDLDETMRMVGQHPGRIVFLCDDPDLPFSWKEAGALPRWSAWNNALETGMRFGGQPEEVQSFDAPFASLLEFRSPVAAVNQSFVYNGRPAGRLAGVRRVLGAGVPVTVVGRLEEWEGLTSAVIPAPTQAQRSTFYATWMAALALADAKHKKLGWRTGRAYHALYAGTPALVEREHVSLTSTFESFGNGTELQQWCTELSSDTRRREVWEGQCARASKDRAILERTFVDHGL